MSGGLKNSDECMDLVILGFPKCGTSALFRAIDSQHGVLGLRPPDGKIETPWPFIRSVDFSLFPQDMLVVTKYPHYIYNDKALVFLAVRQSRRFALCIRDARSALVSWWAMHMRIARSATPINHFAYIKRDFYGSCSLDEYYYAFARDLLRYDIYFEKLLKLIDPATISVISQERMAGDTAGAVNFLMRSSKLFSSDCIQTSERSSQHISYGESCNFSLPSEIEGELVAVNESLQLKVLSSGVLRFC